MAIPAPRFDYEALATPGGIGQGLAALGGALANAAARRRQAEAMEMKAAADQQGLARLQSNDVINRENRRREFGEQMRQGDERIKLEEKRIGLAGLAKPLTPVDDARIRNLDASTERLKRPAGLASLARDPRIIPAAVWNQLDQEASAEAMDAVNRRKLDPAHRAALDASKPGWFSGPAGPAPMNDEQYREEVLRKARERRGLHLPQPWQAGPAAAEGKSTAPIAAQNAPTGVGTLRKRALAAYGNAVDDEVLAAIAAAEAGDEEAAAQLEEMLAPGKPLAPEEDPTTLLGP